MSSRVGKPSPPDQAERNKALDPRRSVLVQAPAGSGKTTLLAERFLRLLAEVDEPGQVVAITFTEAAAAEMRNRVLNELRNPEPSAIARRTLEHSEKLGWKLLDLPAQLQISTIDSFCRNLALQQPLVSGLGGGLEIAEQPEELYRRAARRTLEQLGKEDAGLSEAGDLSKAIEALLLWRDNNWQEIENQIADMLRNRDRWMHDFVLDRDPDWAVLRERLECSLARDNSGDPAAACYTDDEWKIVRACFKVLRHAAGELHVVFTETGTVDFTEVAQIALQVLAEGDDAALAVADGIHHLLVDEFQDTSRRQHQLLAHLVAAWDNREGRTCFVVGDPMQSIYFFRDADAELFPRVGRIGLEIPDNQPLLFDPVQLMSNFRTVPQLVERLNATFARVFAVKDGSGVEFTEALATRGNAGPDGLHLVADEKPRMLLHTEFVPSTARGGSGSSRRETIAAEREAARQKQIDEIVDLIRSHLPRIAEAHATNAKYRVAVLGRTRKALATIASALRDAGVPFRAVELEPLKARPEIIDALALARALLNPQDRVAWLGVLRAPWCGLSLPDLHTLVSADDAMLLSRSIPELFDERKHFLSEVGRVSVQRVIDALGFAERMRFAQPTASTGTWLEQVWLRLGGAQCVDTAARANLDLLWSRIDSLPEGERDLLGTALDTALDKLYAQPDPAASSECGVQLMTIHKSKGLEFEVVIVPELQARETGTYGNMLSWLERGLAEPDKSGEVTEFLVAPLQSKGSERSKAKEWVDQIRRAREKQELRRLLYVAATRARDELHIFARPEYKAGKDGSLVLADPVNSLLKTAWPAFETEIRAAFNTWVGVRRDQEEASATIGSIAASGIEAPPTQPAPAMLRRLPANFSVVKSETLLPSEEAPFVGAGRLYERHEGGLISRALGQAVHTFLQQLAELFAAQPRDAALAVLSQLAPRIVADIRSAGIDAQQASRIANQAIEIARKAATDPTGQWILSPHVDAASEVRWTGVVGGNLRTVQVDRVFRAGANPQTGGASGETSTWWIIDYKTAHQDGLDTASTLPELRRVFAPQIEVYAKVLRNLHGADAAVRAGLYYPRMSLFDWWEL